MAEEAVCSSLSKPVLYMVKISTQQWIVGSLSSINDTSFSPSGVIEKVLYREFFYLSKAELDTYYVEPLVTACLP